MLPVTQAGVQTVPHRLTQLNALTGELGVPEVRVSRQPPTLRLGGPPAQEWLKAARQWEEAEDSVSWGDAGLVAGGVLAGSRRSCSQGGQLTRARAPGSPGSTFTAEEQSGHLLPLWETNPAQGSRKRRGDPWGPECGYVCDPLFRGGKLLFQAFRRAWPWHHPDPWGFSGKDQNWVLPGSWSNCTRLAAPRRDVEVSDMVFRCPPRSLSPSLLCIPPSPFRGQAPSPRLSGDHSPLPK